MKAILPVLTIFICYSITGRSQPYPHAYSRNIYSVAGVMNNAGKGAGLNYERILGKKRRTSAVGEVSFCFTTARRAFLGSGPTYVEGVDRHPFMLVVQSGFHFYATNSERPAQYVCGTYLMAGWGKGRSRKVLNNTDMLQDRRFAGVVFGNGFQAQLKCRLMILLEACIGLGVDDGLDTISIGDVAGLGQLSLKLGYRI